jgi:hypothetical protein
MSGGEIVELDPPDPSSPASMATKMTSTSTGIPTRSEKVLEAMFACWPQCLS